MGGQFAINFSSVDVEGVSVSVVGEGEDTSEVVNKMLCIDSNYIPYRHAAQAWAWKRGRRRWRESPLHLEGAASGRERGGRRHISCNIAKDWPCGEDSEPCRNREEINGVS